MRKWRMGSLTLGIILISLGCGFVLSKLVIINSIVQVLSWWPLAIIFLGIEALVGGLLFTDQHSRLKFDGFSVMAILLTFFICAGSFLASVVPWGKLNLNLHNSSLTIANQFGGIELFNTLGSVDVKNENGTISVTSDRLLQNDVKLQAKFGGITLNLKKDQEGSFNLYTRQGSIKSEFPINIIKNNSTESCKDAVGSSMNKFDIKNENGNILINKN